MTEELNEILTSLQNMILLAYWKNKKHCGSDFKDEDCAYCEHFQFCLANDMIRVAWQRIQNKKSE